MMTLPTIRERERAAWNAYAGYIKERIHATPSANAEVRSDTVSAKLFNIWKPLYRERNARMYALSDQEKAQKKDWARAKRAPQ